MIKKLITWLFKKPQPEIKEEITRSTLRLARIEKALSETPPPRFSMEEVAKAMRPGNVVETSERRITTFNHPELVDVTTMADAQLGVRRYMNINEPPRGSNEN